ncbi:MAG: glycoside hydrolase family 13 protein [Clostridia bacterium]|nr:glycoside hydrolase family 13 protein [Clostridia bacterium]
MRFFHNSRDVHFRRPQGAACCNQRVNIGASIDDCGDFVQVFVRLFTPEGMNEIEMERSGSDLRCELVLPAYPCLCHYDFKIVEGESVRFYVGQSGEGRLCEGCGERYQLTVYYSDFTTPERFANGIAYQIFPDRFFCSDKDAFMDRIEREAASGRMMSYHENWLDRPMYLPHAGVKDYVPDDYYGGDLNGIAQKLDYLKSLNVTHIYLNPIFEAHSNHRYNTGDYMNIDRILGSNEDFANLAREAEKRGIGLILDGVFSHTGDDSVYFNRYKRYSSVGAYQGEESPYYPWYRFKSFPDDYDCWWGFETLPNVNELEPSYVEFIQGENGVLRHWQSQGASGWRLDVADELPDEFIRGIRRSIKAADPNAVLIGEVWEDCSNKMGDEGRRAYVNGDLLDGAMNYPFLDAVLDYLCGKTDAFALNESLQRLYENYPRPFLRSCLNLISSHDEPRALSKLSAPDITVKELDRLAQADFVYNPSEVERGKKRLLSAMALQFTMEGVPCIYYGDEAGLLGMSDPFNRRAYPWGCEDETILDAVRRFTALRTNSPAIRNGHCRMGAINSAVFAMVRYLDGEVVVLLVNNSDTERDALFFPALLSEGAGGGVPLDIEGEYTSLDGEKKSVQAVFSDTLPAFGYSIWRKEANKKA